LNSDPEHEERMERSEATLEKTDNILTASDRSIFASRDSMEQADGALVRSRKLLDGADEAGESDRGCEPGE
jgi:hypothetical protein